MQIHNVHERVLAASPERVGALLDGLSGRPDPLWPEEQWPPMRFDGPLQQGAAGGHGPIRYEVDHYEPGLLARFRFTGPRGLHGTHTFAVMRASDGALLRHAIKGRAGGRMWLLWPLVFQPLHNALLEDALDKAARAVGDPPDRATRWSWWVRLLRRLAPSQPQSPPA